jgi:hypothetical protein
MEFIVLGKVGCAWLMDEDYHIPILLQIFLIIIIFSSRKNEKLKIATEIVGDKPPEKWKTPQVSGLRRSRKEEGIQTKRSGRFLLARKARGAAGWP